MVLRTVNLNASTSTIKIRLWCIIGQGETPNSVGKPGTITVLLLSILLLVYIFEIYKLALKLILPYAAVIVNKAGIFDI